MHWYIFLLLAYLFTALHVGLRTLLAYGEGGGSSPSFLLILTAFIVLSASPRRAIWAVLALGILADLTQSYPTLDYGLTWLLGPMTLGYLLGAYAGFQVRGLMFRNSPVALACLTFLIGAFAHLAVVALITARGLPWLPADPIAGWDPWSQIARRFGELLYTTIIAIPVGWLLIRSAGICGFDTSKSRRSV